MTPEELGEAFRKHNAIALAGVLGRLGGDFELAEDALQDAWLAAAVAWAAAPPANPAGWLVTTAHRKALDRLRRSTVGRRKLEEVSGTMPVSETFDDDVGATFHDERLRLIFTCCHPALAVEARVALTLKTVGGLTTGEIARAFLAQESAVAQRIARAKRKIRDARIPYRIPDDHDLPERLPGVLTVLYVIFTEGYSSTGSAALVRSELCHEAIRLASLVATLLPGESEVLGLLALMLLQHSRTPARQTPSGDLVLLDDQDRSLWDRSAIQQGLSALTRAGESPHRGPYQVQAGIAAVHATARSAADTDWHTIARLYDQLVQLTPTPVVALNRAVAHGMANGPVAGIALLDQIEGLESFHLYHAARADTLRRMGRSSEALAAYTRALDFVTNPAERQFLWRRLAECETSRERPGA